MTLTEYRCPKCGFLLFKTDAVRGVVQAPCPKCRALRTMPVDRLTDRSAPRRVVAVSSA